MRDPERIPEILDFLADYWLAHPDLRLGQIIGNAGIEYYTEDDAALRRLRSIEELRTNELQ